MLSKKRKHEAIPFEQQKIRIHAVWYRNTALPTVPIGRAQARACLQRFPSTRPLVQPESHRDEIKLKKNSRNYYQSIGNKSLVTIPRLSKALLASEVHLLSSPDCLRALKSAHPRVRKLLTRMFGTDSWLFQHAGASELTKILLIHLQPQKPLRGDLEKIIYIESLYNHASKTNVTQNTFQVDERSGAYRKSTHQICWQYNES